MRSYGRSGSRPHLLPVRPLVTLALAILACGAALSAESSGPAVDYRRTLEQETELRAELDASSAPRHRASLLKRVHAVVAEYEHLSDHYRASGYSDNALWQGAML